MALSFLVLVAGLVAIALLLWWPAVASAEAADEDGLTWLQGAAPFPRLATATPVPTAVPTLTPGDVAAQFEPSLRTALSVGSWEQALEIVAIVRAIDPVGEQVRNWAYTTAMQYGQALVEDGQVDGALTQFDQAATLLAGDEEANLWLETTQLYQAGRDAAAGAQWEKAVQHFESAEKRLPNYGDLFGRLTEAYRGQGQAAIEDDNWALAIEATSLFRERSPSDPDARNLLSQAYRGHAQAAMTAGRWSSAIDTMTEARAQLPGDGQVTELLSRAYLGRGQSAMARQDWTAAIEALQQGNQQLPGDQEIVAALSTAFRQRGIALEERATRNTKTLNMGMLREARSDFQEALALLPGNATAQAYLVQVDKILFPPKRIEVDISQQRLYAWEGDRLVYKFKVSTGLRGQDTATGRFRILDKIPMAYSRIWRLRMPNWMGIYYVQGIENGFHGLPYRPDGTKMWGGLLGRRASYGCIVLGTKQAKTLYNWAEIGTRVDIHR